jgi:hypothetical protein
VLEASHLAAYCLPDDKKVEPSSTTWEFDHMLAMNFGWWEIVLDGTAKNPSLYEALNVTEREHDTMA